jgi:hypothetical protein
MSSRPVILTVLSTPVDEEECCRLGGECCTGDDCC